MRSDYVAITALCWILLVVGGCDPSIKRSRSGRLTDAINSQADWKVWIDFDAHPDESDGVINWCIVQDDVQIYFWNGKSLGDGNVAFGRALLRVCDLPDGSVVVIRDVDKSHKIKDYPFEEWFGEMERIAKKRHIVFVFSPIKVPGG